MNPTRYEDLPRTRGLPLVGHSLAWMRDPIGLPQRLQRELGDVFVHHLGTSHPVVFAHPDAIGDLFADEGGALSTAAGWRPFFGRLLPGGLLLRDHDDHRHHRAVMQSAFAPAALREHVRVMNERLPASLDAWPRRGRVSAVDGFRRLTLDLAGALFLGAELGPELDALTHDFETLAAGVAAVLPVAAPGTALRRAIEARERLVAYLRPRVAARRAAPTPDLFGRLCEAADEHGRRFTDDEVIDHTLFLWMAAHDTTAGSLVMTAYQLARDPAWQSRVRDEALALGEVLPWDRMHESPSGELVAQESLRLHPPVGSVPRTTLRPCVIGGVALPAGVPVRASILLAQRHRAVWSDPDRFDPLRFAEPRAEHRRHRHAYRPFGGGAHACLGMRFAMLQIRVVLHHVVRRWRFGLAPGYALTLRPTPGFRPADGLPLELSPLAPRP